MFIGYQNGVARYVANNAYELAYKKCVTFDKIEEVEFAEMFNGVVYTSEEELFAAKTKAIEEKRAGLYAAEVDPITAHINRLRDEELTPEVAAEIARLVEERKAIGARIKEENPYPVEPVEETEELPVEEESSVTEEVVPEIENTIEEID